ncbi:MAG TPA: cytochrome C [Nitrospirota bacterium]|nr:cytochrome C [Nitrospirota bacterium]
MKKNLVPILLIFTIVAVLYFISSRQRAPLIPADALHQNIAGNAGCAECHGPGKKAPLKANHPPKEQCLICHRYK